MKRFQHVSFTTDPAPRAPAPQARDRMACSPPPRDAMWRSRRVLSGSDWMDAWVQKPGRR